MTDGAKENARTTHESDVKGIRETFKEEWNRRTWYGKLWFPLWALERLAIMFVVFSVLFVLAPGVFKPVLPRLTHPIRKAFGNAVRWVRGLTPEVYND